MEERMDFRILNNGSFIPSIGYGTYKTGTEGETEQAVANARSEEHTSELQSQR